MAFDFETLVREAIAKPSAKGTLAPSNDPAPIPAEKADAILEDAGLAVRVWDQPMPPQLQRHLDRVLDYIRDRNLAPSIVGTGSPLDLCTRITQVLQDALPVSMQRDLDPVIEHVITYICDYCEESGAGKLALDFKFKRG